MGTGFDIATSPEEEGIIPRAVAHLFEGIDKRKHDTKQRNEPLPDFKVTVQFMEVRMIFYDIFIYLFIVCQVKKEEYIWHL